MGVVIGFVWMVIGYVLMQTSIQVWAAMMLPNPVERARQRVVRKPWASFFIGLAVWGVTMLVGGGLVRLAGAASLIGYALMAPMFAASVIGGGAFSRVIGERIARHQRNESQISALIGGAFATTLAGLLPVIGWFMFLPITGFIAIGAGTLGILSGRRVEDEPVAAPAPAYPAYAYPSQDASAAWLGHQPATPAYPVQAEPARPTNQPAASLQ